MGPTSSGKTTLAKLLHRKLVTSKKFVLHNEPEFSDIILDTEVSTPKESFQELIFEMGKIRINI